MVLISRFVASSLFLPFEVAGEVISNPDIAALWFLEIVFSRANYPSLRDYAGSIR
jgi:hypothetical protein